MKSEIISALEKQADHERYASTAYLALSHWCQAQNFSGFAEFFCKQAEEESEHAHKILAHLIDRGCLPALGALEAPKIQFSDLQEAARTALALEKANTAGIHAAYEVALGTKDYAAQIHLQWFIMEQVEEEAWAEKMVAKVKGATCAGSLYYLDRHIVKELAD